MQSLVTAISQAVRLSVAQEVRDFLRAGKPGLAGGSRPPRIVPCIAPGCGKSSKGPRFHYLCETHRTAPKKEWEQWRKLRLEKAEKAEKAAKPAKAAKAAKVAKAAGKAAAKPSNILPCIAPGCGKASRGPRFHFLCEDHRNAPKKEWEQWKKARAAEKK